MSVLIAANGTSAEITLAAGDVVSLALVGTAASGVPNGAVAAVSWKGAASNTLVAALTVDNPTVAVTAPGTFVVTKGTGAYTVERS